MVQLLTQGGDCLWDDALDDDERDRFSPAARVYFWCYRATPRTQWQDLLRLEQWRLLGEFGLKKEGAYTEVYPGGPIVEEIAREALRSQWIEQGIWDNNWDVFSGPEMSASWKHEVGHANTQEDEAPEKDTWDGKGFGDGPVFGRGSGADQVPSNDPGPGVFGLFGAPAISDTRNKDKVSSNNPGPGVFGLFGDDASSDTRDKDTTESIFENKVFEKSRPESVPSNGGHFGPPRLASGRWGGLNIRSLPSKGSGSSSGKTPGGPFRNPAYYSSPPEPNYSLETLARQDESLSVYFEKEVSRRRRQFEKGLPLEEGRREMYNRLVADNPSTRFNMSNHEAQLERDKEASRPIHQFNYQVAKERDRIYQEHAEDPNAVPQDISTQAYEIVKNQWRVRHIWNEDWGILPGMYWVYEEEEYVQLTHEMNDFSADENEDQADQPHEETFQPAQSIWGNQLTYPSQTGENRKAASRNKSKKQRLRSKRAKKRTRQTKRQQEPPSPLPTKAEAKDYLVAAEAGIALLRDDPRLPSDFGKLGWLDEGKVNELRRTGQWADEEIDKNVSEMRRIWDGLPPWPRDATWRPFYWLDPLKTQMARLTGSWSEEIIQREIKREENRRWD